MRVRLSSVTLRLKRDGRMRVSAAVTTALCTLWVALALVHGALPVEDGSLETATMLLRSALV